MSLHTSVDGVVRNITEQDTSIDGVVHKIKEMYTSKDGVVTALYTSEKPGKYIFNAETGEYVLPNKVIIYEIDSGWERNYNITTTSYTYGGYTCYQLTAGSNIAVYYTYSGDIERGIWWSIGDISQYSKVIVTGYNSGLGQFTVLSQQPTPDGSEFDFRDFTIAEATVSGSDTYELDVSSATGNAWLCMYAYSRGSANRTFALSMIKLEY